MAALASTVQPRPIPIEKLRKILIDGVDVYADANSEDRAKFIDFWRKLERKKIQQGKPGAAKLVSEYIRLLVENFG